MRLSAIKSKVAGNKTLLNGSLFSLFSFFNQGVGFVLLILLAEYIAPAEYGSLSMFNTVVTFLGFFIAMSTQGFLAISYFKRGPAHFKEDVSAISLISLTSFIVLGAVIALLHRQLSQWLHLPTAFLFATVAIAFFHLFFDMRLNYLRVQEKVTRYGLWSCTFALISFALSLYLVIGRRLDWEGRAYANLICSIAFGVLAIGCFFRERLFTFKVSADTFKTVLYWGVPLIPHLASVWIKQGGDRLIINEQHSLADVGLFSFALNLTSIIIMIGSAFNATNSVSIYKTLSSGEPACDIRSKLRRQTRDIAIIYLIAYVCIVLGASLLTPLLLPRYAESIPYFLILSLQGLGQCFYFLYSNYLFYYHLNKQLMFVTFTTSVLHLLLSLLLTRYSLIYTCCIYVFVQVILVYSLYKLSRKALTENLETS